MDHQKYKSLESMFNSLCNYLVLSFEQMAKELVSDSNNSVELAVELQQMGLGLRIGSNEITLISAIDQINVNSLKQSLIKHGIKKKVNFHFISKSTNELAQDNIKDAIYISDYQSQGKGRQSKIWQTPVGQSIAMSISHRFDFGLQQLSGLNIVIGVAIIQTLSQFGGNNMGLKWPNDIIGNNGKVAGILIEASGNTNTCRAIIGIGINCTVDQTSLDNIDQPCGNAELNGISRTQLINHLIINTHQLISEFIENGLATIQAIWHQYDINLNKEINFIQSGKTQYGQYKGINKQGCLKVEIKTGSGKKIKTLASGEVSIRTKT